MESDRTVTQGCARDSIDKAPDIKSRKRQNNHLDIQTNITMDVNLYVYDLSRVSRSDYHTMLILTEHRVLREW